MTRWRPFGRAPLPAALGELIDLRPVSKGRALVNKAGRIVMRGTRLGSPVKVYEAASPAHATFIAAASGAMPDLFPPVQPPHGAWVIADWVAGSPNADVAAAARALRRVQAQAVAIFPDPGFDYWADFIAPRFLRAATLAGQEQLGHDLVARVDAWQGRAVLSHPDLTPANLLATGAGLRSIDNELLGLSRLPALDALNAARPLKGAAARAFRDAWGADDTPRDVLGRAWIARQAGSALVAGDFGAIAGLLEAAQSNPVLALPESWRE